MTKRTVLLSGLHSDSHTWGLAYLKLRLEEQDFQVRSLGSCVAPNELAAVCREEAPALVVLTSVNGHGAVEAIKVMEALRAAGCVPGLPVVIGGKLTTSVESDMEANERLTKAGFSGVFTGADALARFDAFLFAEGLITKAPPVPETVSGESGGVPLCQSH